MYEKEAAEYADKNSGTRSLPIHEAYARGLEEGFQDGAEFSYNKANEWHYAKDGLPKDNEYVLVYTDLNNCYVAKKVENHFMSKCWGFIAMRSVIAWKETTLPKEVEK